MKYWRGYLVAAIFAAFALALQKFSESHGVLVDMVYPYVSRMIQTYMAEWSSGADFLIWQLAAVLLGVILLVTVVLMLIFKWNPIQWAGWVAAVACFVFFLHTGLYGLNSYAGSLADDIRLDVTEYTLKELEDATAYYRDNANALAPQIKRDSANLPAFDDFATLAQQAGEGFDNLKYDRAFSVFAGSKVPVKELGWADMYTSMGITGFTFAITGEAAVNPQIPQVSIPFTMCHEMAHRMCIAKEDDANFAAFLACDANTDVQFRYSAYFMAFRYCYNALARLDGQAASRVSADVCPELRRDLAAYDDFFTQKRDEQATQFANTVNDAYIKTNGDNRGTASYGEVCDLLISWYVQEVILPQQVVEEEEKFDPYDESQVDLSGLVNERAVKNGG